MQKSYSLKELANQIGATVRGNADVVITDIAPLDKAQAHQLTFISNAKFRPLLKDSKAGILVVSETDVEFCAPESHLLIVKDPYVAYAILAQYMDTTPKAA
ncbi:LpxD N-terminal domain-containing protein, partial [Rodentibacter trehalosifermentans]